MFPGADSRGNGFSTAFSPSCGGKRRGREVEAARGSGPLSQPQHSKDSTNPEADVPSLLISPLVPLFVICSFSHTITPLSQSPQFTLIFCLISTFQICPIGVSSTSGVWWLYYDGSDLLLMLAGLCIEVSRNNYKCGYVNEFTGPCRTGGSESYLVNRNRFFFFFSFISSMNHSSRCWSVYSSQNYSWPHCDLQSSSFLFTSILFFNYLFYSSRKDSDLCLIGSFVPFCPGVL